MLKNSLDALRRGGFVIVHDGNHREGEADLMVHASFATPEKIARLRKDAGGLICLALGKEIKQKFKLDYLADIYLGSKNPQIRSLVTKKTPYGDQSAFSISVNSKSTYTGITDADRSKTITKIAALVSKNGDLSSEFSRNFYTPGHVPLLFARDISERKGHTELSVKLCELASLPPAIVICEMLGKGSALSLPEAKKYARKNKIPLLEYSDILSGPNGEMIL